MGVIIVFLGKSMIMCIPGGLFAHYHDAVAYKRYSSNKKSIKKTIL